MLGEERMVQPNNGGKGLGGHFYKKIGGIREKKSEIPSPLGGGYGGESKEG